MFFGAAHLAWAAFLLGRVRVRERRTWIWPVCYHRNLAAAEFRLNGKSRTRNDEGVAEDGGGEGAFDGAGAGAGDWADGRAGAREGGVDLRNGFAHLWVGPLVAGTDQA